MLMRWLASFLFALCAVSLPARASVDCTTSASVVCSDEGLRDLNAALAEREAVLAKAAMRQAMRSELEDADDEWQAVIGDCAAAADAVSCARLSLARRIAVLDLLNRLFGGPLLPQDAGKACALRSESQASCHAELFAAADTVYAIAARAFDTSLAAVNIQTPTGPDGSNQAESAEEAFRVWRTAQCKALSQSTLNSEGASGGLLACETGLTWKELASLALLLGRQPHWSERIADYAPRFRACLDRGREDDVDLRIIDVFASGAGEVIRLLGSRGRYDCVAVADTVSAFGPADKRSVLLGEGEAVFVPVQGSRPPESVLGGPGGDAARCYETQAVIAAEARLSGWMAVSRCARTP
jgi:hypothetical protein